MGQFLSILWTLRSFLSSTTYGLEDCLHYFASNSRQVKLEQYYAFKNRLIDSNVELGEALETLFLKYWKRRSVAVPRAKYLLWRGW